MEKELAKPLVGNLVYSLLGKASGGWTGKPSDWSDIRKDCPANSIALYAGHTADYSQYDNLGFTATCTGGYNVFIDGTQYGSTYASGSQCTITWSSLALTTGDDITTPTALKAHKIWVEPATSGNNITAFKCARVAASGVEAQGVLWAHFNISNYVSISKAFGLANNYDNSILTAITAKNNILNITTCDAAFTRTASLQYVPLLCGDGNSRDISNLFSSSGSPAVSLKNFVSSQMVQVFREDSIKKISLKNVDTSGVKVFRACFYDNRQIEELPVFDFSSAENMQNFLCMNIGLNNTILDVRSAKNLQIIGCYSTSQYFMSGFKGLRVSNEAPFTGSAPQINVSYTGMDRAALVQLFNDLPYNVGYEVVGSPTITDGVASGFSNSNYLQLTTALPDANGNDVEIIFKAAKLSATSAGAGAMFFCESIAFDITNGNAIRGRIWTKKSGESSYTSREVYNYNFPISGDTPKWFKFSKKDQICSWECSNDGETYTTGHTYSLEDGEEIRLTSSVYLFNATRWGNTSAELYLNNTEIYYNDTYWFRGQPAMTKTLSCVGATGTADLTAEDKDIALNKGWSLTLS